MGLKIVYGRAGSGKTVYCLNEIQNELGSGDNYPLILIVPEQFSLQAEKNLAKATSSKNVARAEVLSFRRLAFRVFAEVGGISRKHLNSAGKSMLLFKIMNTIGNDLKVFKGAAAKKGFTQILSDSITEFKRYDIKPEQLQMTLEKLDDGSPLKDKISDLALIYAEFEKLLHQNYMDADDDLAELCRKLDQSTLFDGAHIWIDEFSGFTPQEYNVIAKLLKKARRVTVSLCTDCLSDDPGDGAPMVFTPVRKTAAKLLSIASKEGIEIEKPVFLDQAPYSVKFSSSEELGHLERNYYKYPSKKFNKYSGDVILSESANMYKEVEDAAKDIIRLCRDKGYRFLDIAVTMRNPESYSSVVKSVFELYEIPFFFDTKRDIDGHPLIVLIMSALEIFSSNWSYESVFRYAKTGLTGIDREELDMLENYVLANGIRGGAWTRQEDWDYPADTQVWEEKPNDSQFERLEMINKVRRQLTEPLEKFRGKTKGGAKAIVFCTALFELLCDTGADKKIEELSLRFAEEGRLEKAAEYGRVWNIVMDVFSQIVEVLGEERLGTERFAEILAAGFSDYRINLIPPSLDQVLVSGVERARSHDIKALYILGVIEGVFPAGKADEGILSDMDRDSLGQLGLELAGNTKSRSLEERFMVYMALATPSKYLWLSYPAADREQRALRPSRLLSDIKRILPLVEERSSLITGRADDIPDPAAPKPFFDELVGRLRILNDGGKIHDGWRNAYKWFSEQDEWKESCERIINGLKYTNQPGILAREKAERLYGKPLFSSVSRMESYASCPFAYFVRYGLKAKERKLFTFEAVDAGTFMHNVLDEFSRRLVKENISWRSLDKKWCQEKVSQIVDEILSSKTSFVLGSSKRYKYLAERLKKIITRAVLLISCQIEMGSFEPTGYEVEFSDTGRYPPIEVELPGGNIVKLTGRIDRIDTMTMDGQTYVRIIDYKSGSRALKLEDVYYGLQLQLVAYLDAVLGAEAVRGDVVSEADSKLPAGILYFKLDDPLIRSDRGTSTEEIEKAIMKELRMKGLVLADVKLVREMDREIDGESLIIPARVNKDGSLGRSSAASKKQFDILREYVKKTLRDLGAEILRGSIEISPYKKKTITACTYCSFKPVCQFDTAIAGNSFRLIPGADEDEIWGKMEKETSGGGQDGQ